MDHRHNAIFATVIKVQYADLQAQLVATKPQGPLRVEANGSQYLCIWNGLREQLDRLELRKQIGSMLGLADFRIIQVVGNSNIAFPANKIAKVKDVLHTLIDEVLPDERRTVLEYGYTSSKHDTNWIMNDIVAARPELGARMIANIVGMSAVAVEEWEAEATSLVQNFVLAYDEVETVFGSDMWLSDDIMFASHGDKLICVEGGPQSFAQAVSVCSRGVQVIAITGVEPNEKSTESSPIRFSAARLLAMLQDVWHKRSAEGNQSSDEKFDLAGVASKYLGSCFNPSDPGDLRKHETVMAALESVLTKTDMFRTIEVVFM